MTTRYAQEDEDPTERALLQMFGGRTGWNRARLEDIRRINQTLTEEGEQEIMYPDGDINADRGENAPSTHLCIPRGGEVEERKEAEKKVMRDRWIAAQCARFGFLDALYPGFKKKVEGICVTFNNIMGDLTSRLDDEFITPRSDSTSMRSPENAMRTVFFWYVGVHNHIPHSCYPSCPDGPEHGKPSNAPRVDPEQLLMEICDRIHVPTTSKEMVERSVTEKKVVKFVGEVMTGSEATCCICQTEDSSVYLTPRRCPFGHKFCSSGDDNHHQCTEAYMCKPCAYEHILQSSNNFNQNPTCPLCRGRYCPVDAYQEVKFVQVTPPPGTVPLARETTLLEEIKELKQKLASSDSSRKRLLDTAPFTRSAKRLPPSSPPPRGEGKETEITQEK